MAIGPGLVLCSSETAPRWRWKSPMLWRLSFGAEVMLPKWWWNGPVPPPFVLMFCRAS